MWYIYICVCIFTVEVESCQIQSDPNFLMCLFPRIILNSSFKIHAHSYILSNAIWVFTSSSHYFFPPGAVWIPLKSHWMINSDANWLVVWNIFCFSIILGMSSSQLTNSILFQRGWLNHQPEFLVSYWKWPFLVDFPIKNCDFP